MKILAVGLSGLVLALPATASTPSFRQQASRLCEATLNQIKQPPAGKPFKALTQREADAFLRSASDAFATLSLRLNRLTPPVAQRLAYTTMLSDFRTSSSAFAQARASFDLGDKTKALQRATAAARWAGKGAAVGKALELGQCGP